MCCTVKFENLKVKKTHSSYCYSSIINYLYIDKLVLNGVTCVTGDPYFVKNTLLSLLDPYNSKEDGYAIQTTFSYNNYTISEDKYKYFFSIKIKINSNETVKEVLTYCIFFCKSKLSLEDLINDFKLQQILDVSIKLLNPNDKLIFKLVIKIIQTPKIIVCHSVDSDDVHVYKVLRMYSRRYKIIFVVPVESYQPEYECVDKWIHIKNEQFKNKNYDYYNIVYAEFMKEMKMIKCEGESEELQEFMDDNAIDEDGKEIDTSEQNIDLIITKKLHSNYLRKFSDQNSIRRFFCIDNYKINFSKINFFAKRSIKHNGKNGDKFLSVFLLFITYFICNLYFQNDSFSKNWNLIRKSYREIISTCFFCLFKNPKETIFKFKNLINFILESIFYPIFINFKLEENLNMFGTNRCPKMVLLHKINASIIYAFIFEGALSIASYETKIVSRNVNVLFTPATYLISIFYYLILTHWIPIVLVSLLFGTFPILLLLSASALSLTLVVIRYYSYDNVKSDLITVAVAFLYIYMIWTDACDRSSHFCRILYHTRKINPIFIARYYEFMVGKAKWRFIGYCLRSCLYAFMFCVYQMSKI